MATVILAEAAISAVFCSLLALGTNGLAVKSNWESLSGHTSVIRYIKKHRLTITYCNTL